MRIIHLSYAHITEHRDPAAWLQRINFFVALVEKMAKEVDVKSIHCIDYSGSLNREGVEYHFINLSEFQMLLPFKLNRLVQQLKPDVVIVHGFHFPMKVILLRWMLGSQIKIVIQHHAERPLRHYKRILQRLTDRFVSAYFFTARDQAKPWLSEQQIIDPNKIYEVMEVPSVFYPMDRAVARLKTKVTNSKNFLWVGRLEANKDPLTLVRAFSEFLIANSDVHLYVIFQSDELIEKVKMLLKISNAETQITLVGKIDHNELLYWYNSVDFIISTSHYEGSGIAVCEGMSCGCIPILTNIPSFKMMTGNGDCGLLFEAGDVTGLVIALRKSLVMNLEIEREKTLLKYNRSLSAKAIATKMINVSRMITSIQN
jgi:glycosyltransferase involved in cell wall biosynthesis